MDRDGYVHKFEEICKEMVERFKTKNEEHKGAFFAVSRIDRAQAIWTKWLHMERYLNGEVSLSEVRKHILDLAIYCVMLLIDADEEKLQKKVYVYDATKQRVEEVDNFPPDAQKVKVGEVWVSVMEKGNKIYFGY
jgi:menaquinone-dependent protoporphyrinogen IX oxidase